jgi:hypothetical protein
MDTSAYTRSFWKIIDGRKAEYTLAPVAGEMILVIAGTVTVRNQSGGFIRVGGTAILKTSGQTGGYCEAVEGAQIVSDHQYGGYCQGFGHSTISSHSQHGGYCRAYNECKFYSTMFYNGGVCEQVRPGKEVSVVRKVEL